MGVGGMGRSGRRMPSDFPSFSLQIHLLWSPQSERNINCGRRRSHVRPIVYTNTITTGLEALSQYKFVRFVWRAYSRGLINVTWWDSPPPFLTNALPPARWADGLDCWVTLSGWEICSLLSYTPLLSGKPSPIVFISVFMCNCKWMHLGRWGDPVARRALSVTLVILFRETPQGSSS